MADEKITLSDLAQDSTPIETPVEQSIATGNKETITTVAIEDVKLPGRESTSESNDLIADAFAGIDAALDRTKKELTENVINPYIEKQIDENLEKVAESSDDAIEESSILKVNSTEDLEKGLFDDDTSSASKSSDNYIDSIKVEEGDFDKILGLSDDDDTPTEEETEAEADVNAAIKEFSKCVKENIKPVQDKIDLNKFTISKKAVSASNLLRKAAETKLNVSDWILYKSGKSIAISELSGPDIEKFNPNRQDRNNINLLKERYSILYNHLEDPNKPPFEAWLKTIAFSDNQDLFFAGYKATFERTNIVPFGCKKCDNLFMKTLPIEDLIEYPNDEVKEKVKKIISHDTSVNCEYTSKLIQASEDYVFAIKVPTVYSVVIETSVLDQEFRDKFNDMLALISYIDDIYVIDKNKNELCPVNYGHIATDFEKSVKRKVATYSKILQTLTSDQLQYLGIEMKNLQPDEDTIKYISPETTCPKCGAKIAKEYRDAQSLLFTRHQLAVYSNM